MFQILLHLNLFIQVLTKYHLILRKTAEIPSMGPSFRFSIKGALPYSSLLRMKKRHLFISLLGFCKKSTFPKTSLTEMRTKDIV